MCIKFSPHERKRRLLAWRRWNSNTVINVNAVRYRDVYVMQLIQHRNQVEHTIKKL
jgi:hypothetical protein